MRRAALAAILLAPAAAHAQTEVATTSGTVRGLDGPDVIRFLGVPYAEPPVGALRWARPQAKAPAPGTIPTQTPAPSCTQILSSFQEDCEDLPADAPGTPVGQEDCLTLDVWMPATAPVTARPVMVWIHGGGFTQGCSKSAVSEATELAQAASDGVVVFAIQYRLGALGFLSTPDLRDEDANGSTGNYGLLDMVLALEWVQGNAVAFGGDPDNVTIFGESAGGTAVCALLATPLSDGLFDRAMAHSGGCNAVPLEADPGGALSSTHLANSQAVAVDAGCPAGPGQLACLRAAEADALVQSFASVQAGGALPVANLAIDGYALDEMPAVMLARGAADGRTAGFGSNADEMTVFTLSLSLPSEAAYEQLVRDQLGDELADAILPLYPAASFASPKDAYNTLFADLLFVCGQTTSATTLADAGSDAYLYHFTNDPNPVLNLGSFHGLELFYVFDNLAATFLFLKTAGDQALADHMKEAWAGYAETGTPATTPAWPLAGDDADTTPLLLFDSTATDIANSTATGGAIRSGRCTQLAALDLNPDLDFVIGSADNCPRQANSRQGDLDGDGVGDACDDGIPLLAPGALAWFAALLVAALAQLRTSSRPNVTRPRSAQRRL